MQGTLTLCPHQHMGPFCCPWSWVSCWSDTDMCPCSPEWLLSSLLAFNPSWQQASALQNLCFMKTCDWLDETNPSALKKACLFALEPLESTRESFGQSSSCRATRKTVQETRTHGAAHSLALKTASPFPLFCLLLTSLCSQCWLLHSWVLGWTLNIGLAKCEVWASPLLSCFSAAPLALSRPWRLLELHRCLLYKDVQVCTWIIPCCYWGALLCHTWWVTHRGTGMSSG